MGHNIPQHHGPIRRGQPPVYHRGVSHGGGVEHVRGDPRRRTPDHEEVTARETDVKFRRYTLFTISWRMCPSLFTGLSDYF